MDTDLYTSAWNLLQAKIDAGGGHTSWSSVWEACLWARLRDARGESRVHANTGVGIAKSIGTTWLCCALCFTCTIVDTERELEVES